MQILSVIVGLALLALACELAQMPEPPPDDSDQDDWGGGSDRNQPLGPWWPPGVAPEPTNDREPELV